MEKNIQIGKYRIGEDNPCFIIAEAGVNHNGDLDTAIELVHKAKEIGSDCIKFQTFTAASVITRNAPKASYQLKVTDQRESQFEMLKKLELSRDDFQVIADKCEELGILFLSTPYNQADVDLLHSIGVEAFKIASGQIVEPSFLEYVAKFNKPIILSTGMADLSEVSYAMECIRNTGNDQIALLQCTTNYPSSIEESNISAMVSMGVAFDVVMGYSDHVPENYPCYTAVALGAKIIEKHFTLNKSMEGPDHKASLDIEEFKDLIQGIRKVEKSLGSKVKSPSASELNNAVGMRRSIASKVLIPKGTTITSDMLEYKRPATGIAPKYLHMLLNREAAIDILPDSLLSFEMLKW
jgi:N-acetylneuraminate synthase/N,N'-diacetyllegionaminate synthase